MTNTTYYNLNIVEGTDIVNPLTVDNPNYEKIDEVMHDNAVSGVTLANEIANGTVHAITRENSECAVIRFIATSIWKAGDTITVDGVPVTALLPSGETLPDGAYVINTNVLCILTGTNMTVFAERKKTDTANDITYKNTNVGSELDKVNSNFKWKKMNSVNGETIINIPSDCSEIYIRSYVIINGLFYISTGYFFKDMLSESDNDIYYLGGGYSQNDKRIVKYTIKQTYIALYMFYQDDVRYTDEVNTTVWYR